MPSRPPGAGAARAAGRGAVGGDVCGACDGTGWIEVPIDDFDPDEFEREPDP